MRKIGIYGGSFDPVHNGHIHLARTAIKCFELDEVIFVPARISPFKQDKIDVAPDRDRLAMLRLAVEDEVNISVSDYELTQEGVSYTIYTIRHMKELYPCDKLVLLMGSDGLMSFNRWYCWQEIIKLCDIGCISRSYGDSEELKKQAELLSENGRVFVSCEDIFPVSSTKIRQLLKKDEDCSCYLPENVVQYILKHKLYGV